jgi:TIR domain
VAADAGHLSVDDQQLVDVEPLAQLDACLDRGFDQDPIQDGSARTVTVCDAICSCESPSRAASDSGLSVERWALAAASGRGGARRNRYRPSGGPSSVKAMPTVFISYRRNDTAGEAGRLADDLSEKFGRSRVFVDVDSIPLATNFEERIEAALDSCRVVFVLIGSEWLTSRLPSGERRLDAEDDYVRQEVARALKRQDVAVVPVLVEGATMPSARDLPAEISTLATINAVDLSNKR